MEQRKRFGGNNGLGYYTSWEKDKDNGCIYCGKPATTREHIPSKAFLIEPFPEIEYTDGILKYTYDVERFKRIITKLAKCHAGFEFDLVDFDRIPDVRFDFIFNLSDGQREAFEQIHLDDY